jgi:uncharacterized membrane protein YbhN (UPF0104 family)
MIGAVVGYAASNIFGWMFGGTAVRFRLYSRWGFRIAEVIAFISVLSVTFWLGMFLLAGIAFVSLPVHLPKDYQDKLILEPRDYGYVFLFIVLVYLLATMFVHKPIRIPFSTQKFSFPPFRLSLLQLAVSASDFALASCVLYVLLPTGEVNYATVLVSYLAAMIIVVILHVPGGIGVLELVVMELLAKDRPETDALHIQVMSGLILFRLIYYILPAIPAGLLYLIEEISWSRSHRKDRKIRSDAP